MSNFESKEQQDFENFMLRYKSEFRDFDKVGDFTYSNTLTGIAYDSYLQGIKSQQAKIDELQARVDEALKQLDLAYPESWGYCVDKAINILKGNKDEN